MRYKGRLVEPEAEIPFQILISEPDKGMIITSPGEDHSQRLVLNGDTAWQVVRLGDGGRKIIRLGEADTVSLAWSLQIHNTFRRLVLAEQEGREGISAREIDFSGKPGIELTARMPDGSELVAVLDKETLYLEKIEEFGPGADGPEPVQAIYGDHREVGGIVIAHKTRFFKNGQPYNESYLESVEINPGLMSALFMIPDEISK